MEWLIVAGGYLLGCLLPADWIVRRRTGHAPDQLGDNPGGAGTWRLAGPRWAVPVILLDIAKGALPVAAAEAWGLHGGWLALAAVAPVAGHNWPLHRRFRGGRGLAPATGALLWLAWPQMLPAYALGVVAALAGRWVPLVGVVAFPIGLGAMLWARLPYDRVAAAGAVMTAVALRQLPWLWQRLRQRVGPPHAGQARPGGPRRPGARLRS